MKTPSALIIFMVLQFCLTGLSGQTVIPGGDVAGIWTKSGSPYEIGGDISVPAGSTLRIQPGTRIEFLPSNYMQVQGSLIAEGTVNDSIFFTVPNADEIEDPENFSEHWRGVRIIHIETQPDSSIFSYCKFEFSRGEDMQNNIDNGGAMTVNYDKVRISNCLFENNTAHGGDMASGGALFIGNADCKVLNNTFRNNSAREGGAIFILGSNPTVMGNILVNNRADEGGAYYIEASMVTITYDSVLNNSASGNGGAVFVRETEPRSIIYFSETIFSGNETSRRGGVIESSNNELHFIKCQFLQNHCKEEGGVMFVGVNNTVMEIDNCEFVSNYSEDGRGVMQIMSGETLIRNSRFIENSSGFSVAAVCSYETDMRITNCDFSSNTSDIVGALNIEGKSCQIDYCTFSDNYGQNGGAISGQNCSFKIKNTSFENNSGTWGGACKFTNSDLDVVDCSFTNNEAWGEAAAIHYTVNSQVEEPVGVTISGTDFVNNRGHDSYSTILIMQEETGDFVNSVDFGDCLFEANESSNNGSMRIFGDMDNVILNRIKFIDNITHSNRSIFGIHSGCKAMLSNCLFVGNQPRSLIIHDTAEAGIISCTFTGSDGTALDLRKGAIGRVANSILWNNGRPAALNTAADLGCTLTMKYCDVQFGEDSIFVSDDQSAVNWGEGNITDNPRFFNTGKEDYSLYYDSPCLEAGSLNIEFGDLVYDAPGLDILQNYRPSPVDTNPDMGAFESSVLAGLGQRSGNQYINMVLQNFPNPFSEKTQIVWYQENMGKTKLEILDTSGRLVRLCLFRRMPAGKNSYQVDMGAFRPGIYFYRIVNPDFIQTKRMEIIR